MNFHLGGTRIGRQKKKMKLLRRRLFKGEPKCVAQRRRSLGSQFVRSADRQLSDSLNSSRNERAKNLSFVFPGSFCVYISNRLDLRTRTEGKKEKRLAVATKKTPFSTRKNPPPSSVLFYWYRAAQRVKVISYVLYLISNVGGREGGLFGIAFASHRDGWLYGSWASPPSLKNHK
jgi:hypothetical protein